MNLLNMANLEGLVDLGKMHWGNQNLVVKKAVEWVEKNRNLGKKILGIRWERKPQHRPGMIRITIQGKEREQLEFGPPETWDLQLTLACWLYSIRAYATLDNRAHIICYKGRSKGDVQNSISTHHPKSNLQEEYDEILSNQEFLGDLKNQITSQEKLPDGLTPVQREFVQRSVNGEVSRSVVESMKKTHQIGDLDLLNELNTMSLVPGIRDSIIPTKVDFRSFSIHEVQEMLKSEGIAPALKKKIDALTREIIELDRELERMKNRSLWERIINRKN